jgi:hypothetical protein
LPLKIVLILYTITAADVGTGICVVKITTKTLAKLVGLAALLIVMAAIALPNRSATAEDKFVGKDWPEAQRVPMDQIDHSSFASLLRKYVDENGLVDYQSWQASSSDRAALQNYLIELGKADSRKAVKREVKLAYWINAYNAVTIEGILQVYPTTSIRNHTAKVWGYNVWKNLYLYSGGEKFNLDSIEHQVLRPLGEPRIHFAIVCASLGCPRLLNEAYNSERLEEQLTRNTTDFFSRSQNLQVDAAANTLRLSSIMSWFGEDFGKNASQQIQAVSKYFPESAQAFVSRDGYRVDYLDYDWKLNEQKK